MYHLQIDDKQKGHRGVQIFPYGASIDTFLKLLYEIWDRPDSLPKVPNLDTRTMEPEKMIY
jgi:hypothetical protein